MKCELWKLPPKSSLRVSRKQRKCRVEVEWCARCPRSSVANLKSEISIFRAHFETRKLKRQDARLHNSKSKIENSKSPNNAMFECLNQSPITNRQSPMIRLPDLPIVKLTPRQVACRLALRIGGLGRRNEHTPGHPGSSLATSHSPLITALEGGL